MSSRLTRFRRSVRLSLSRSKVVRGGPRLERLEERQLLSVAPSAFEQYALELMNRARLDPLAEAALYGIDLNEGLTPGTITSDAKQPLAFNAELHDAIVGHLNDILENDFFDHVGSGGSTLTQRVLAAGYTGEAVGENLGIRFTTGTIDDVVEFIDAIHESLFINADVPGRTHRLNILDNVFNEVGPGIAVGLFAPDGPGTEEDEAVVYGQDFGDRPSTSYLTGVAFADYDTDVFYSVGEGLAGVTITAVGGQIFSTQTSTAGGYALALPPGTYTVTALGGALAGPVTVADVTIGAENVKLDFQPASITWTDVFAGDFNGDGRDDVAGRAQATGDWWVALTNSDSIGSVSHFWTRWSASAQWVDVRVGDFNGDGRDDLIGRVAQSGEWWTAISDADGIGATNQFWTRWSASAQWTDTRVGDLNNDGRDDLVSRVAASGEWWAALAKPTLGANTVFWARWSASSIWLDVSVADLDGNGNDDIVGRVQGSGEWWAALTNPAGTGTTVQFWDRWSPSTVWLDVQAADLNGDGKADLVGRSMSSGEWWASIANPAGSRGMSIFWTRWSATTAWYNVVIADINDDGLADVVGRAASSGEWWAALAQVANPTQVSYLGRWMP